MIFIYTTCKDTEEAKKIGKTILEQKLAVCVNFWPIESAYLDNGTIIDGKEAVLIIKTNESKVQDIEDLISTIHTYSTPFIGVFDIKRVNRAYKEWMAQILQ